VENDVNYYLFELGKTVVKCCGGLWYERDPEKHQWELNMEWDRRFFDGAYNVIEIDYDEDQEMISNRRRVPGFWSIDDDRLLLSGDEK